jgi:hypothetical protein
MIENIRRAEDPAWRERLERQQLVARLGRMFGFGIRLEDIDEGWVVSRDPRKSQPLSQKIAATEPEGRIGAARLETHALENRQLGPGRVQAGFHDDRLPRRCFQIAE